MEILLSLEFSAKPHPHLPPKHPPLPSSTFPSCFPWSFPFNLLKSPFPYLEKRRKGGKSHQKKLFAFPWSRFVFLPSAGGRAPPQWGLFDFPAKRISDFFFLFFFFLFFFSFKKKNIKGRSGKLKAEWQSSRERNTEILPTAKCLSVK